MTTENFKIVPVPEDKQRGWVVEINGKEESSVRHIKLNSNFGSLEYGLRPEGFDGPVMREKAGMVTLLVSTSPEGKKYVGMPLENRPNMGPKPVFCILGGMAKAEDKGSCCDLMKEIVADKAGIDASEAEKYNSLHWNSNRLYWAVDPKETGTGVHGYRLVIPFDRLIAEEDGLLKLGESYSVGGKSDKVRFFPIKEAPLRTGDALALSAVCAEMCEFGC